MGDKVTLKIEARDVLGKKVARLRREGIVPAVVYGAGMDAQAVQANAGELKKVVKAAGRHSPVHLTGTKRRIAMIKDVDTDPVRHEIRHVSFHAVKANEPVVTDVPIHLVGEGESAAEKAGLVILQSLDTVEIKALPMDLPEALEVSVEKLAEEGDKLLVADITLPENVELVDTGVDEDDENSHSVTELVVATVYEPSALQAANEAAAGDAEDESEVEAENGAEDETGDAEATEGKEQEA